jgi:arsenite methyltransferase
VLLREQKHADASCCGQIYRNNVTRMLLGDSWHPGGLALTGELAHLACLGPTQMVLDIACGNGSSASFLAREFGCLITGIDILPENAKEASSRSSPSSSSRDPVANEFIVGDSHKLPLMNESFDAAILECTLSSFQNKKLVLREINRVLKPNAKLGISDVVVNGNIPNELREAQFQELCVAGALSLDEYCGLFELAGFEIIVRQNKRSEALEFIETIRKKLFVAQLLVGVGKISVEIETINYARHLVTLSKKAIDEDKLGYAVIVSQKKRGERMGL